MTITDRIKLNGLEYYNLLRNYFEYTVEALQYGYFNINEIKYLIDRLKDYKEELGVEDYYLSYLEQYKSIINENELDRVLELIDRSNERIYEYYDSLGDNYVSMAMTKLTAKPRREVSKLDENLKITDEIVGLTIRQNDIRDFFHGVEGYYYAQQNAKKFNAGDDLSYYGISTVEENGIIRKANMVVPPLTNLQNALVNVHETQQMIDLFDFIGKKVPDDFDFEQRAKDKEELFIQEYVRNK